MDISDDPKEWKLVISDEAMADLDRLGEKDAQQLVDALQQAISDGTLFDQARRVDMDALKRDDPVAYERITGEKVEGN